MTDIRRDDRLKGKVAIVNSAGSRSEGIGNGRATAVIFARHGAKVTLVDTVAQWAEETRRLIEAEGGVCQIVEGDVSDPSSCQAIVARTVDAWGRLDILVNNVGIPGPRGNAVEVDLAAWDSAMRVNVASMMLMAKYAIPAMIKRGGGRGGGAAVLGGDAGSWDGGRKNSLLPQNDQERRRLDHQSLIGRGIA